MEIAPGKWCFFTHHCTGDWEGRAASLLPVTWVDGWPIIGKVGTDQIGQMVWSASKPIETTGRLHLQTSDDFRQAILQVQWEWNFQPKADKWSLTDRKGYLRLYALKPIINRDSEAIILRAANTITQRSLRTKNNKVTTKIDYGNMADGQYAGLTHFSTTSYTTFGIKQQDGARYLYYDSNGKDTASIRITGKYISGFNPFGITTE